MANLPDISTESNLPAEDTHDDDELDPRVQVCICIHCRIGSSCN